MESTADRGTESKVSVKVVFLGVATFFLSVAMAVFCSNTADLPGASVVIEGLPEIREFAVLDAAGVLSPETHDYFNRESRKLQLKNGGEIFVATFRTLPEYAATGIQTRAPNINELATFLFNKIGLGSRERNNGALILFTTETPHVVLRTGSGLESCIPDAMAGRILDDYATEDMRARRWNNAAVKTWNAVAREIYRCYRNEIPENVGKSDPVFREGTSKFYEEPPKLKGRIDSGIIKAPIFFFLAIADAFLLFVYFFTEGNIAGGGRSGYHRGFRFSSSHSGGHRSSSRGGSHGGGRSRGGGASR